MTLVIKRKKGQTVRIGESLVTVLKATEGEVKLGIDAPSGVDIVRGELEAAWVREGKKDG